MLLQQRYFVRSVEKDLVLQVLDSVGLVEHLLCKIVTCEEEGE